LLPKTDTVGLAIMRIVCCLIPHKKTDLLAEIL
jgi:hypothetical protein